jgi:hypothetical protein
MCTSLNPSLFQPKDVKNDDDDVRFVLDQHVELDFYRAIYSSLKQHSTSGHVVLLAYVILIPIKAYFLVLRS